jgi:SAM-dependent methyltransferase
MRKTAFGYFYDTHLLRYVEYFRWRRIEGLYSEDIETDYRQIRDYLPARALNILDIGCGMAGIDVHLFKHFAGQPKIFLLDKTRKDFIFYGYKDRGAFYNDFHLTGRFLEMNGVPMEKAVFIDAEAGSVSAQDTKFDLVISLISWGFHYPLQIYFEEVLATLAPDGAIIVDVRKGTDNEAFLASHGNIQQDVIADGGKFLRVRIKRKN